MTKLLEQLTKLFQTNQQSRLEQYITSKNPTNAAEVDYWARQYDSEAQYWGRGLWKSFLNPLKILLLHIARLDMNTLKNTTSGTKLPTGEKIAGFLIVAMVIYLFIAQ